MDAQAKYELAKEMVQGTLAASMYGVDTAASMLLEIHSNLPR